MNEVVLKVSGLTKKYKNLTAVDNLSFSLQRGEIVGFIGSNGAGKSTTMKIICGLAEPTSGQVEICGINIKHKEKALENIGAIIEAPHFYPYLTAKQNLNYFSSFYKNFKKENIDEVLKLVDLYDRRNDRVGKYSLGMKQRLGIAQAILNNPKLLILDEPTNGLDAEGIIKIRQFLLNLRDKTGLTIFISSHILSELQNLCDRFIIIDAGRKKDEFSKSSIQNQSEQAINTFLRVSNPEKAAALIENKFEKTCKIKNGKVYLHTAEGERSKILLLLSQNNIDVDGIGNVKVALEKKYLDTIKK